MADDQRYSVPTDDAPERDVAPACPLPRARPSSTFSRRLAELLAKVAAADRDAFTQFYRSTQERVFGLSLRIVRRRSVAEEITQEVYLQIWAEASRYDERLASPLGWLMMLTHRRAVDRVRSESHAHLRELAYGYRAIGRDHDAVAEAVGQRSEERAVARCLTTLTDTQRDTLALAYYDGRTYSEVAEHLGIPLSTVKTRIRAGLERLRNCLTGSVTDV
ncbi:sigma-70 family RNA polymerase sigma factor [Nocardia otitidiscaviarum]|uniref:Sigma-70 family RNA polymerase sigma factor n=1 Tax=Nocardia otitidiscaviarum TaxID=1823 RepID=A0A516NGW1_9NOCA|nr:ECF RNA polymerase sigma factor SigK [Nocardia otitidiscaviarum]MCP9622777.1 ECF RNA polymerase sigma factor SigK [Nocardia otitidiscaviarum]QDP78140.1 sigma-70 family RNA polymerase sigma factor [Nocardia otitidiscaviarum]